MVAKGRTCKNREQKKIHKLTNAQIDALLTKIMDNLGIQSYVWKHAPERQEWHMLSQKQGRLFENTFWNNLKKKKGKVDICL